MNSSEDWVMMPLWHGMGFPLLNFFGIVSRRDDGGLGGVRLDGKGRSDSEHRRRWWEVEPRRWMTGAG